MKQLNEVQRVWYVVDATHAILGRLSSVLVKYLVGKHKLEYTPYLDKGDYVIVLNAKNVCVTGRKNDDKIYYRHTGYVGGIKKLNFKTMIMMHPARVIEIAVRGMLPKGILGRAMYRRLRVYPGNTHDHIAQSPQVLSLYSSNNISEKKI